MCAFRVFLLGPVHVDALFFVYLGFLVDKTQLSKDKICIQLKLYPDVSIVLKLNCAIKMILASEVAVSQVLAMSLACSEHSMNCFYFSFLLPPLKSDLLEGRWYVWSNFVSQCLVPISQSIIILSKNRTVLQSLGEGLL